MDLTAAGSKSLVVSRVLRRSSSSVSEPRKAARLLRVGRFHMRPARLRSSVGQLALGDLFLPLVHQRPIHGTGPKVGHV